MDVTKALAQQLRILSGDLDRGDGIAAALTQLGRDLTLAVPSCLAVSIIILVGLAGEITVSILAPAAGSSRVLASLAVPLSAIDPGDILVLRAGEAGAFLLLADDLDGRLCAGHLPIQLDRHLSLPSSRTGESLASSLATLGAVNQGIGVLVDRGFPPEAAREELQCRADEGGVTIGVASRLLLKSLSPGRLAELPLTAAGGRPYGSSAECQPVRNESAATTPPLESETARRRNLQ